MKQTSIRFPLIIAVLCVGALLTAIVAYATSAVDFTTANGALQDNHVNDLFLYDRSGESSSDDLAFDAHWWRGVAKTSGDPTSNPSTHITLSGTQTNKAHRILVGIESAGVHPTGTATFQTSLDGGATWSTTIYTTRSTAQDLEVDGTDTGLDITFASGANWAFNDVFTVASWWAEGAGDNRSSTRDFPQRAAILVTGLTGTSDGGVEIIDLSDNSVWMRFVASAESTPAEEQNIVAGPVHSVTALNGKIYLGGESGNMRGVGVIDLMADKVWFYDDSPGWDWISNIAMRNDGGDDDAGWIVADPAYPSLTTNVVYDLDATVALDAQSAPHTYVAIGTSDKFYLLKDHATLYYNEHCIGSIPAVAFVGNDVYWSGILHSDSLRYLCARNDITTINGSGTWPTVHTYGPVAPHSPFLISRDIRAITGRDGLSPVETGSNILYVGTDAGLSIIHEKQSNKSEGESYHYGFTGSGNDDLDYKLLAGTTDQVSAVGFADGYTAVYVATNDGAEGGAVSVLRPYIHTGDIPYRIASYRTDTTPAILSNDVSALAHGSDLLVGTDESGANRMEEPPTAVTVTRLAAHSSGASDEILCVALLLAVSGGGWVVVRRRWLVACCYSLSAAMVRRIKPAERSNAARSSSVN